MNYVNKFAYLSLDEQKAVGLFICHLFANAQTQSWALYFSEWKVGDVNPGGGDSSDEDEEGGEKWEEAEEEEPETTSNGRVTAKVTRLCLHSLNPTLQSYGGAIAHNLAIRRVRVMQRPLSAEDEVQATYLGCLDVYFHYKMKLSRLFFGAHSLVRSSFFHNALKFPSNCCSLH